MAKLVVTNDSKVLGTVCSQVLTDEQDYTKGQNTVIQNIAPWH